MGHAAVGQVVVVVVVDGLVFEAADLAVAQPVVAEGEDLAGDRDLGDVAPAAFGDPFEVWRAAVRRRWGSSARLRVSAQRSAGEPWWEMCPRRALPSELRTVGASPAQAHRCWAVGKRVTSPTSAMISIAV